MGVYVIKMPDIGEGIAEVELVEWQVKEGDTVAEDQVLADVMTDKATVQVPSPVHGKVIALGGKVGEVLAVGAELIRLEVDGPGNVSETHSAVEVAHSQGEQSFDHAQDAQVGQHADPVQVSQGSITVASPSHAPAIPVATAPPGGSVPASPRPARRLRPLASPAVRRRAHDAGIDLRAILGTGAVGQVTHEDLDRWLQRGEAQPATGAPSSAVVAAFARREGEEEIAVVGLRRKIAQKMQQSKRQIPHFTYVEEIDVTELETLRHTLNQRWAATRGKLTLLPFLVRALVVALKDYPQMNARFDDERGVVVQHAPVHLGVAAQTDAGLMVPVLRHAETHDLWACAAEILRLAQAVRSGSAQRDELAGSTITLSSLGALGGLVSTPVINYPEVAIVGVNRVVERPVVLGGSVVIRKMMNLSSSFDHRVVDGMHAAEFIQCIRAYLECPSLLFVE